MGVEPRPSSDVSGSWSQAGTSHDLARANTTKIGMKEPEPPEPGEPRDPESLMACTRAEQGNTPLVATSQNVQRLALALAHATTSHLKSGSLAYQEILHFPSEDGSKVEQSYPGGNSYV